MTKIEDLKDVELYALPNYVDIYMTNKIRTYGDKVYINFRCINVPEDDIECGYSRVISINSSLVYNDKYYLQVFFDNCAYKIVDKQMADHLDEHFFEN